MQCGLETYYWTGFNHFVIWGSIAIYFVITLVTHTAIFGADYLGVSFNCMNTANFWFTILLCAVILLVPVLVEKFYYVDTRPTLTDKVVTTICNYYGYFPLCLSTLSLLILKSVHVALTVPRYYNGCFIHFCRFCCMIFMSNGPPHSLPQRLRFSEFLADIVRFIN